MTNSLKKAIQRITTFLASIAILYSCADSQEPVLIKNVPDNSVETESRTIQEAISEADKFLGEIDNNTTRTNARRVGSVECINSNAKTRSSCNDTIMYLINYSGNNGFALVGKSKHSDGIYAISPEGHLDMSDTIENKGLAMFVGASVEDATVSSIIPIDGPVYEYMINRRIYPLLSKNIAGWHQGDPFNKYYVAIDGRFTYVGCGPVAVGMMCAYYQYPNRLAGRTINWNAINNNNTDEIARFLTDLGSKEYLDAKLNNTTGTRSVGTDMITHFFSYAEFDTTNAWMSVAFSNIYHEVFDFMKSGKNGIPSAPVLFFGNTIDSQNKYVGHFWIVDGFIERVKKPKLAINNPLVKWSEADPYLHCVWGWGDTNNYNGYYLYLLEEKKINNESTGNCNITWKFGNLRIWGAFSH